MAQHHGLEFAHITRNHTGQTRRFHIACPPCQAPLDRDLTLAELRGRHRLRPSETLTAACGHTDRLPQPFPAV